MKNDKELINQLKLLSPKELMSLLDLYKTKPKVKKEIIKIKHIYQCQTCLSQQEKWIEVTSTSKNNSEPKEVKIETTWCNKCPTVLKGYQQDMLISLVKKYAQRIK